MVEVIVERLVPDASSSDAYVVVLREKEGRRLLPIWIRRLEAEAIAEGLQQIQPKRPLTHDLCRSIIGALGGTLQAVHITRVKDDTYYAKLLVAQHDGMIHVDARPSDCIAIAVRMNAPIFAQELLLSTIDIDAASSANAKADSAHGTAGSFQLTAEQLKAHLQKLRPEDFGKFSP
ncbi:MAG: bifunctional nuclease family protein [Gemmatimonadaceae bacterium]